MDYEGVKSGLADGSILLIDVRNPGELQNPGKIVGSQNVPLGDVDSAFAMDDGSFKAQYGFDKPAKDAPIVTSCLRGGRADGAAKVLEKHGYTNVKVYSGSFLDWQAKGGAIENSN